MYTNIKSAGTSNNKNENIFTSDIKAVDVKVERESDDEEQQSDIDLYEYTDHVIKVEVAMGHEEPQHAVFNSNCSEEIHSESSAKTSEQSQNHYSNDHNGSVIKLETEAMSTVKEEQTEELYVEHEIKYEMVIGPVVLQAVTYMMEENGEPLPKKPRLHTQDKTTEPDNTAKQTRTETNTEEFTPHDCNEYTEPSDTEPMENVKNKIATKTSKPRNNTQTNISNDKNNKTAKNIFQCNDCAKQYDKKPNLLQHIESHDKTKLDIYFKCKECRYQSVTQCSLERHLKLHDKSRRFVCDVCGYRYTDNTRLHKHLRNTHSNEKIHECGICDYKTNIIHNLNTHLRIHSGEKPYSCSECEFKCSRKSDLKKHSQIHTDEKPYSCSVCQFKCNRNSSLRRHSKIHTGEKPYKCSMCEFKCNQKINLKRHSRIHTGEKPYSCSECNYKCTESSHLKQHLRTHSESLPEKPRLHTQDKNTEPDNTAKQTSTETYSEEFTPQDCNEYTEPSDTEPMENVKNKIATKTSKPRNNTQTNISNDKNNKRTMNAFHSNVSAEQYDNKSDLAQHIEIHDRTKRDIYFKCKECTYQSVTQCSLERHLRLHDKSRHFVCDVCGYRYMVNKHLKQHLKNIHSGEKTHECRDCEYKTNNIGDLNTHFRIHSGEMPYSCSQCDYKCNQKNNLKRHSQIHTGEKPYSCSLCEYKCNQKSSLKRHSLIHTGEKLYSH